MLNFRGVYTQNPVHPRVLHTICRGDAFRIARARRVAEATRGPHLKGNDGLVVHHGLVVMVSKPPYQPMGLVPS